jgi:hypothetical protein
MTARARRPASSPAGGQSLYYAALATHYLIQVWLDFARSSTIHCALKTCAMLLGLKCRIRGPSSSMIV